MKSVVADYQTRVIAARVVARNGSVIRIVQFPTDIEMGGNTYKSDHGYQVTNYSATSSMSPSTVDMEGILGSGGISRDEIASGIWDGARIYLFATSWTAPTEDEEPISQFIFGKAKLRDNRFSCELMQLIDVLSQDVGRTVVARCTWDYGDEFCGKDLALETYTGTITSVTDTSTFSDSSRDEDDGFFIGGDFRFTTGSNASNEPIEISGYSSDTITTFLPFHYMPQVGDEYEIRRGCGGTRAECKERDNILNFGGFPDQPTNNMVNKFGGQ